MFRDIYTKIAATRALKELRKAIRTGDTARVKRLAPHAVKEGPVGTELKHLGTGSEQAASVVYSRKKGLHTRTVENPLVQRTRNDKADYLRAARILNKTDPQFAKAVGRTRLPSGIRMTHREYVPGTELRKAPLSVQRSVGRRVGQASAKGYDLYDHTNSRNVIVGPKGPKVIDFLAAKQGRKYNPASKGEKSLVDTDAALKKTLRSRGVDPFDDMSMQEHYRTDPRKWLGPGSRQKKKARLPQEEMDRQARVAAARRAMKQAG